jgi:hypothetical protein
VRYLKVVLALFLFAAALAFPNRSYADAIVYNNFGPGNTFTGSGPAAVEGGQYIANAFTVTGSSFDITQISLALFVEDSFGEAPDFTVQLLADSGGEPGSVIQSWSLTSVPDYPGAFTTSLQPGQTISGITGVTLTEGTTYWLEAQPTHPEASPLGVWDENSTGAMGPVSYEYGGVWTASVTQTNFAFQILGNAVSTVPTPEPASLVLLGTGMLALVTFRRFASRMS